VSDPVALPIAALPLLGAAAVFALGGSLGRRHGCVAPAAPAPAALRPDRATLGRYRAGEEDGLAFIAMECVKGHDLLRHALPGRLLPVSVALETMARVARLRTHAGAWCTATSSRPT
jgi:hypothetical protein